MVVPGTTTQNFVLEKDENGTTDPRYTLSGTVTLQIVDGGDPASPVGSRVSIWAIDGDFQKSDSTNVDGWYQIEDVPPGRYQAGAAREGFTSQVTDPFDLSGDRTQDFQLVQDPLYDWGPGEEGDRAGCSCVTGGAGGTLLGLLGLLIIRRRKWPR